MKLRDKGRFWLRKRKEKEGSEGRKREQNRRIGSMEEMRTYKEREKQDVAFLWHFLVIFFPSDQSLTRLSPAI